MLRFVMHNREIPCSIDQPNGHHVFRQACCVNVFCRHISRILRSLDFGQFHWLCTSTVGSAGRLECSSPLDTMALELDAAWCVGTTGVVCAAAAPDGVGCLVWGTASSTLVGRALEHGVLHLAAFVAHLSQENIRSESRIALC